MPTQEFSNENGGLMGFYRIFIVILMDFEWDIPSGYVKIPLENGPSIVELPIKHIQTR